MKLIRIHIKIWASAAVVFFALTSAGVTAVIEICCEEMEDAPPSEAVYDEETSHEVSYESNSSKDSFSISEVDDCHERFIAGGLSGLTAVVEKDNSAATKTVMFQNPVVISLDRHSKSSNTSHNLLLSRGPSPPPVDKYILISTFLI